MDLILGVSVAMTFCCHSCGVVTSVLRLNGSPREFQCTSCQAVYRVSVERIGAPKVQARIMKASEYVKAGA